MTQIGEGRVVAMVMAVAGKKCPCCGKDPCASPPKQVPKIVPIAAPANHACGGFSWKVWFDLPKRSCNGGWIVQEITFTIDRKKKDGTSIVNQTYHYWEACEVKPCKDKTVWQDGHLDDNDDQYSAPSSPNSKGSITVRGKAKFYEGPLPGDFKQNNPQTLAGILHATTTKPAFWDGGGATHDLVSTWDCTDGQSHPSTLKTVP